MAEVVRRRQTSAGVKDIDPYGQLARRTRFEDELAAIRMRSRSIWSRPDTSLTTNGHFYGDPEQDERTPLRPTSVARHHNPHPKLYKNSSKSLIDNLLGLFQSFYADRNERNTECIRRTTSHTASR